MIKYRFWLGIIIGLAEERMPFAQKCGHGLPFASETQPQRGCVSRVLERDACFASRCFASCFTSR